MSKRLLDEFESPLANDADGSLWLVVTLLMEVHSLIKSAGKFSTMDFQAVNTIKTNMSVVMELLMFSLVDEQQLQKANHIARDEKLLDVLLLLLKGKARESILLIINMLKLKKHQLRR